MWAFGYNLGAIALAVSGLLQPILAALLMAGSSLLVVMNSLRLERFADQTDNPVANTEARSREQKLDIRHYAQWGQAV